jgi:hypothetical protein
MNGTYQVTKVDGINTTSTSSDTTEQNSNFQRTFKLKNGNDELEVSLVEKPIALRAGNTSNVRCEIRYGKDDSLF